MDNYTQLGISGVTLAILFFIVRYFVKALDGKDKYNKELTEKFIKMSEQGMKTQTKLTKTIETNTNATKDSTDHLTKLILEIVKDGK